MTFYISLKMETWGPLRDLFLCSGLTIEVASHHSLCSQPQQREVSHNEDTLMIKVEQW